MVDNSKILVGVDGSVQSMKALAEAITLAKCFKCSIKVITVHQRRMENKAEEILSEAKQLLEKENVEYSASSILGSNPARALQSIAKQENFDLIVVGNRGLGSAASLLIGSVSQQVVVGAECNVLVVKKYKQLPP
jgi:nucleotide-binding universal stress UspA family protein